MRATGERERVSFGKEKFGSSGRFVVEVETEVGEGAGLVSLLKDRELGLRHGLGWDDRKLGQGRKGSEGEGGEGGR